MKDIVKHERVIKHNIREEELHRVMLDYVANMANVDLSNAAVTTRVYSSTYTEGSLGSSKPEVVVEITVDLSVTKG